MNRQFQLLMIITAMIHTGCNNTHTIEEEQNSTAKPTKLVLSPEKLELSIEGSVTELNVTAYYEDNSSQKVESGISFQLQDSTIARISSSALLQPKKEGKTTLEAHYQGIDSNLASLTVYREVDGYRLPLDPGEEGKNTIAGIDSNHNEIRDDIERWIYLEMEIVFPEHIRIERAIAMQHGKIIQKVLLHPENAKSLYQEFDKAANCFMFYKLGYHGNRYPTAYLIFDNTYRDIAFNTKVRQKAYYRYNSILSGDVYPMGRIHPDQCDFDIKQMVQEVK